MDKEIAYILSQSVCALIEAMGMAAENKQREIQGDSPAFSKEHFDNLINQYGIHHSGVVSTLNHY